MAAMQVDAEEMTHFTCLSCRVGFSSSEGQRQHYKTDWHRYNLKRKIAGMIPVSADNFRERVAAQEREKQAQEKGSRRGKKESNPKVQVVPVPLPPTPAHVEDFSAPVDEDSEAPFSNPTSEETPLTLENCIFCPTVSSSFEESLKHMTNSHSFFVPDIEYIQDLEGLIRFLQSKVSEDHFCMLCNGKGRGFGSLDAVRKHMVDKGHCMIDYSEAGCDEISEFYDFSTSYPDWEDVESGEEDADLTEADIVGAELSETGYELILPTGARAGHRALRRYYRQHFRQEDTRDSVVTQRIVNSRRAIGGPSGPAVLPVRERVERDKYILRAQYMRQVIALRQNMLQFHMRAQVSC